MYKFISLVVACVLIASACSQKGSEEKRSNEISNQIVLFNMRNADRQQIAKALDAISACQPKVIAVNAIFERNDHTSVDSVLSNSISIAKNVILVSTIKNEKLINSDSMFVKGSLAQGVLSYGLANEKVSKYKAFVPWRDQTLWSFPVTVISYFDFDRSAKIMNDTKGDWFYDIPFYSERVNSSIALDSLSKMECASIKDKIVLIGYLGPGDEDAYPTPTGSKKMYGTIILANIITSILEDKYRESDEQ